MDDSKLLILSACWQAICNYYFKVIVLKDHPPREIKLIVRRDDFEITKKGGNAHDQTVHETGVIPVSALSFFYAAGAARGMR